MVEEGSLGKEDTGVQKVGVVVVVVGILVGAREGHG